MVFSATQQRIYIIDVSVLLSFIYNRKRYCNWNLFRQFTRFRSPKYMFLQNISLSVWSSVRTSVCVCPFFKSSKIVWSHAQNLTKFLIYAFGYYQHFPFIFGHIMPEVGAVLAIFCSKCILYIEKCMTLCIE